MYFIPKITTYTLIQFYSFISFQENFPPIRLFRPILLFFFEKISYLYFYSVLYVYQFSQKNPTYTFIQTYTFVNFQQKVPPIGLFPPILIIIFKEISHLYFYSEPSSIRNSRVCPPRKIKFGHSERATKI